MLHRCAQDLKIGYERPYRVEDAREPEAVMKRVDQLEVFLATQKLLEDWKGSKIYFSN